MRSRNTESDFWRRVARSGDSQHWLWQGARNTGGYGTFSWQGQSKVAHYLAFYFTYARWPLALVNLCAHPECVRPEHWREPAPAADDTPAGCPFGHPRYPNQDADAACPVCAQERKQERRLGGLWRPQG